MFIIIYTTLGLVISFPFSFNIVGHHWMQNSSICFFIQQPLEHFHFHPSFCSFIQVTY